MKPIEPPDSFHLNAALGWLELGNPREADAELLQISPALLEHPAVLELRWQIEAKLGHWPQCLAAANRLLEVLPDNPSGYIAKAYALRRIEGGSLEAARSALQPALAKFPQEPVIPYNLACYACRLGQLDHARALLKLAFALAKSRKFREMALDDSDLRELWGEIRQNSD